MAVASFPVARLLQRPQIVPVVPLAACVLAAGGDGAVAQFGNPGAATGMLGVPGTHDGPFAALAGAGIPVARLTGLRQITLNPIPQVESPLCRRLPGTTLVPGRRRQRCSSVDAGSRPAFPSGSPAPPTSGPAGAVGRPCYRPSRAQVPYSLPIRAGLPTVSSTLASASLKRSASARSASCTRPPSSAGRSMRHSAWPPLPLSARSGAGAPQLLQIRR